MLIGGIRILRKDFDPNVIYAAVSPTRALRHLLTGIKSKP